MWYWVDTFFTENMETSEVQPFTDLQTAVSWWLAKVITIKGTWLQNVENEIRNRNLVTTQVCPKLMTKNRLIKTVFQVTFYETENDTIPDTDSQDSYASITDSEEVQKVPDAIIQNIVEISPKNTQRLQKLYKHIDMIARLSTACIDFWSENQFSFIKMRWYLQRDLQIPFKTPTPHFLDEIGIEPSNEPFVLKTYSGKCIYPDYDDYGTI